MRRINYYDEFETINVIGEGGFGRVTHSISKKNGKSYAVKEIDLTKAKVELKTIQDEVDYLRELSYKPCNPNVVCYYDIFQSMNKNSVYIVMEYVQGKDMKQTIKNISQNLDDDVVHDFMLLIIKYLLKALVYIHSKNIVHADIKPTNIIIKTNSTLIDNGIDISSNTIYKPMLLDFGLSCKTTDNTCNKKVGTPIYVAPEVLENEKILPVSDVWSLGISVITSLGLDPWAKINSRYKGNVREFLRYVISKVDPPPKLETSNKLLNLVVNSMLIKDPLKRKTADEILKLLDNVKDFNLNPKEPTLNDVIENNSSYNLNYWIQNKDSLSSLSSLSSNSLSTYNIPRPLLQVGKPTQPLSSDINVLTLLPNSSSSD